MTLPDIPIKPKNKATTSTHQTGGRIVTSQQFLKVLREKEEKKKQLEEEKMLRKLERERKRKEKELQKRQ